MTGGKLAERRILVTGGATGIGAGAVEALGGLDVLVHCAGWWAPSTPEGVSEEDLDFLFGTNLKATVFTNQAAFAHLRTTGGAIVNVGSVEGVTGNPIAPAYALS